MRLPPAGLHSDIEGGSVQDGFWRQVLEHGVGVVEAAEVPTVPTFIDAVRVVCDGHRLSALHHAREALARRMDREDPGLIEVADRLRIGLRRRLMGTDDRPESILTEIERLYRATDGRAVLVFESVQDADADTLQQLEVALGEPDRLTVPLVLVFDSPPAGKAALVLDLARARRPGALRESPDMAV
ncbi:MAG: hypothetical protein ACI9K2_001127, partial [Myxococcota bacterium]